MDYQSEINNLKRQIRCIKNNPYTLNVNGVRILQNIREIDFQGVEYSIINNKLILQVGQTLTTTQPFVPTVTINLADNISGNSDGVTVTINQIESNTSFQFAALNPPFIGFPASMEIRNSNEDTILVVDFYTDYQGQPFNFIYLGISNMFTFNNNSIVYI
jgi:hypothetical protein